MDAGPWSLRQLQSGVEWWFDEDLPSEWFAVQMWEAEQRHQQQRTKRSRGSRVLAHLRHPLRSLRFVLRSVERRVVEPPALIDAVFIVGYEDVARLLLRRAKEEHFVSEHIEDMKGPVRILYTWQTPEASSEIQA